MAQRVSTMKGSMTPTPTSIRVLCVDDLPDITKVMQMMIDAEPDMKCVGCLHSANQLVEEIARHNPAGESQDSQFIVVLDASMPGKDSFEALRDLSAAFPSVRTIIYSGYDGRDFADRAIDAGAWGCISKSEDPSAIVEAVRLVAAGQTCFPETAIGLMAPR